MPKFKIENINTTVCVALKHPKNMKLQANYSDDVISVKITKIIATFDGSDLTEIAVLYLHSSGGEYHLTLGEVDGWRKTWLRDVVKKIRSEIA